jgi:ABC-type anion transport system duplicated permease subunit
MVDWAVAVAVPEADKAQEQVAVAVVEVLEVAVLLFLPIT